MSSKDIDHSKQEQTEEPIPKVIQEKKKAIENNPKNNENKPVEQKPTKPKTFEEEVEIAKDERKKYLAKKNVYSLMYVDGDGNEEIREYPRKPLKTKYIQQIINLRNSATTFGLFGKTKQVIAGITYTDPNTMVLDSFRLMAKHALGITDDKEYENLIWEEEEEMNKQDIFGLNSVLEACLLRGIKGGAFFTLPSK